MPSVCGEGVETNVVVRAWPVRVPVCSDACPAIYVLAIRPLVAVPRIIAVCYPRKLKISCVSRQGCVK